MRKRPIRNKPMIVDGQRYLVSLTARYEDIIDLRVTIRADFGMRSFATISGLTNFDYFHHYGFWSSAGYRETADTIEITPRLLAVLIRYARDNGWKPESERTRRQFELTNVDARSLLEMR